MTLLALQLGLLPARPAKGETQAERALRLWGALLRAESQRDLEVLVEEEPGMSDAVSRLMMLALKLGPVGAGLEQRVRAASLSEPEWLTEKVLAGRSLDELFE